MNARVVRRALERLPAKLRSFVTGFVALAVVVTTLLAGHTYFYCAPMQRVAFDECCGEQHEEEHGAGPAIDETHRCCEARTFAEADTSRGGVPSPVVLAAPLASVLPAVPEAVLREARVATRPRLPEQRAGPPPSSPLAHRVPVDVSLS